MQPVAHGQDAARTPLARLDGITRARRRMLVEGAADAGTLIAPWIARSWQRCLALGHAPQERVGFDPLPAAAMRRARERNRLLTQAAQGTLHSLGRALADTRYFAILTNADGVVVDVSGPIDRSDRRADLITRVGVDLSERCVGTTAIGAALTDLQPVWLHRGEHFFVDTSVYSCAGVPLFGPTGSCVGMLDLTGVEVAERPELLHLAQQSARSIENAMTLQMAHTLLLRLNWPGHALGGDSDALVALDADGQVVACNRAARDMVPLLHHTANVHLPPPHASEMFALPFQMLFDASGQGGTIDLPLWSGLHLQAVALPAGASMIATTATALRGSTPAATGAGQRRLRDIETALIRRTVEETRGNVAEAAARLGVSRATVYRRLGMRRA
ncbi:histidine kinase [Comamonadaceae bacterium G21597-S1]|nr:histidine kinase [Comamonadaceae bacterium G21597-S1]